MTVGDFMELFHSQKEQKVNISFSYDGSEFVATDIEHGNGGLEIFSWEVESIRTQLTNNVANDIVLEVQQPIFTGLHKGI